MALRCLNYTSGVIPPVVAAASFQAHFDLVTINQGHGWLASATKCRRDGGAVFDCTAQMTDYKTGKTICLSFKLSTDGRAWYPQPRACSKAA